MTITQFNRLNNDRQVEVVWKQGAIVSSRIDKNYKYLLLQVYGFYVEIRYNARSNALDFVTTFVGTDRLDPYLSNIDISMLLSEAGYE